MRGLTRPILPNFVPRPPSQRDDVLSLDTHTRTKLWNEYYSYGRGERRGGREGEREKRDARALPASSLFFSFFFFFLFSPPLHVTILEGMRALSSGHSAKSNARSPMMFVGRTLARCAFTLRRVHHAPAVSVHVARPWIRPFARRRRRRRSLVYLLYIDATYERIHRLTIARDSPAHVKTLSLSSKRTPRTHALLRAR